MDRPVRLFKHIKKEIDSFRLKCRSIHFCIIFGSQFRKWSTAAWDISIEQIVQLSYWYKTRIPSDIIAWTRLSEVSCNIKYNCLQINIFHSKRNQNIEIIIRILSRSIEICNDNDRHLAIFLISNRTGDKNTGHQKYRHKNISHYSFHI